MQISIIGFGYIGKVLTAFFLKNKFKVLALDNDNKIIHEYKNSKNYIEEKDVKELIKKNKNNFSINFISNKKKTSKIIFLTVGTPIIDGKPSMKMIFDSCDYISKSAPLNSILVIKSTLLPGTTDAFVSKLIKKKRKDISVIYSPERLAEGTALEDLEKNKIIISSPSKVALTKIEKIFKQCSLDVIKFNEYQSAEITKLANNLWIDINIAIGNELSIYCKSKNLNSIPIIEAANSLKKGSNYVNILKPSIGVGGYCLPKDPYFIYEDAKKNNVNLKLPKIGRKINDEITIFSAEKIFEFIKKNKIKNPKLVILGVAFKNNTGDIRSTPIKKLVNIFENKRMNYHLYDPLVNFENNKIFKIKRVRKEIEVSKYDIIIFGCAHKEFKSIKFPKISRNSNKLIFDGRQFFSKNSINKLISKNYSIFSF